eukprot:372368_1
MALSHIDNLISKLDSPTQSTDPWLQIIGDRTAESMKTETAFKFNLDKKSTNAYKRLMHLQTLFAALSPPSAEDEKCACDHDHDHDHDHVDIFKPIDDILDLARAESAPTGDAVGAYTISSTDDLALDCNFTLKGSGKWYYEVELSEDPNTYQELNIGFATPHHSARSQVGHDGASYGYNGVKNKLYNMTTDYGEEKWKADDVLGFALDLSDDKTMIEFFLNGKSQGIAFEGIDFTDYLCPGFTIQNEQNGVLIVDEAKFKQKKPDGYSCITIDNDAKQEDVWQIDGDITVESVDDGVQLTANAGFPTAVLKAVQCTAGNKYYYEFVLGGAGCMQLGYGDSSFKPDAGRGEGIGDDAHSWGCDFLRCRRWGIFGKAYCNANWSKGDVVGCVLDLDKKQISYALNGKDLGIAFDGVDTSHGMYPSISVRNAAAREISMEYYKAKRGAENPDDLTPPDSIKYFDIIFCDAGYKYKPDGVRGMTDQVAFQAMDICNALKQYSYEQYKEDYAFMDTVIMLSKDEEFDEIMKAVDAKTLVVVDFWATWCGPCIYIAPHYHQISAEFPEVVFLKADVDKLAKLSKEQGVNCMPTFKLFKNGAEVHKIEGADKQSIIDAVKKYSQDVPPEEAKQTAVIHVESDEAFKALMAENQGVPLFVDFFAEWCGPCKNIAPEIEKLASGGDYKGIVFVKVDVDKCAQTSAKYEISAMPTFKVIVDEEAKAEVVGASLEKVKKALDEALKLTVSKEEETQED